MSSEKGTTRRKLKEAYLSKNLRRSSRFLQIPKANMHRGEPGHADKSSQSTALPGMIEDKTRSLKLSTKQWNP
ncbi:hypothetical protein Droror1_Dr00024134 [Drosera rotundifolia]